MGSLTCLAVAAIAGLAACGGQQAVPAPLSPRQTAVVYEIRSAGPADGWVWRANTAGGNPVRLTRGRSPVLAPDRQLVAFTRFQATSWSVWVSDLNGRSLRQVFTESGVDAHGIGSITWSPDSSMLAVTDDRGIWLVDTNAQTTRSLPGTQSSEQPSFSPDSTRIAYADDASGRIMVASVSGLRSSALTSGPEDFAPVWGRTGIAFARPSPPSKPGDIWLVQPDGLGMRELTHPNTGILPVAFSADGARLLGENPANHNGRIWAVDVPTGVARDLTGWVGDLFSQGISRDGTSILAALGCGGVPSNRGRIEVIPFAGGRPHTILVGPCRASWNA